MNIEVKAQWLNALRSGEYKQGTGCLREGDKYCILGVLCDLYVKQVHEVEWDAGKERFSLYGNGSSLPDQVSRWAGLGDNRLPRNPYVDIKREGLLEGRQPLAALNDEGWSFEEIADLIEEHL